MNFGSRLIYFWLAKNTLIATDCGQTHSVIARIEKAVQYSDVSWFWPSHTLQVNIASERNEDILLAIDYVIQQTNY